MENNYKQSTQALIGYCVLNRMPDGHNNITDTSKRKFRSNVANKFNNLCVLLCMLFGQEFVYRCTVM